MTRIIHHAKTQWRKGILSWPQKGTEGTKVFFDRIHRIYGIFIRKAGKSWNRPVWVSNPKSKIGNPKWKHTGFVGPLHPLTRTCGRPRFDVMRTGDVVGVISTDSREAGEVEKSQVPELFRSLIITTD